MQTHTQADCLFLFRFQIFSLTILLCPKVLYLVFRFRLVVSHSTRWIALLRSQILGVLQQDALKLGLAVHIEQLLTKVHVGKYGGKRATRLQGVLCAFLLW